MFVSSSLPYNSVSVSSSSPYSSVPVSVSSSIGSMGVFANITSLPQPAPIMLPQTTDHSTDQVPLNTTTSGYNTGTLEQIRDKELLLRLWDKGYTPINSRSLQKILVSYPDQEVAAELLDGFSNGFRLKYTGPRIHTFSKNLLSAEQHKNETLLKLQNEVKLGRILDPFKNMPISKLQISPIGLVPKPDRN